MFTNIDYPMTAKRVQLRLFQEMCAAAADHNTKDYLYFYRGMDFMDDLLVNLECEEPVLDIEVEYLVDHEGYSRRQAEATLGV